MENDKDTEREKFSIVSSASIEIPSSEPESAPEKTWGPDPEIFFKYPIRIGRDQRGALKFPPGLTKPSKVGQLLSALPTPPAPSTKASAAEIAFARDIYRVFCVCLLFPEMKKEIEGLSTSDIEQHGKWKDLLSFFSELGGDVELVIQAAGRLFLLTEVAIQQWGKYSLSQDEVAELERVAMARRTISIDRASWELSEDYAKAPRSVTARKSEEYDAKLESVTTNLWRILHMGQNYMSTLERYNLKVEMRGLYSDDEKKARKSFIEEKLITLRLSYLSAYRKQREEFEMPDPF